MSECTLVVPLKPSVTLCVGIVLPLRCGLARQSLPVIGGKYRGVGGAETLQTTSTSFDRVCFSIGN